MAIIKDNPLGKISGKLGNIIIRQRYGKTIICARPASIKDAKTPEQIINRQKFTVCTKLASAINKHPLLLPLWKLNTPRNKSVYPFIFKNNIKHVGPLVPGDMCVISPPDGFPISAEKITSSSSCLSFRLPPISEYIPVAKDKFDLNIAILISWSDPVDPDYPPFAIEPLSQKLPDYNSKYPLTIKINFSKCKPEFRNIYIKKIIFLTLFFHDTLTPKLIRHSITLSFPV